MLDTKNLIKLIIYSPHGKRVISYNINAIIRCYIFFNFILRAVSKIKKVKENLGGRYNFLLNNKKYKVRSSDKSNKDRRLEILATKTAKEVARTKIPAKLSPMNSYERHIIHEKLASWRDVYTESEGEGEARAVVIKPKMQE